MRVERTYGAKQQSLADKLRARKDPGIDTSPHIVVEARAGTGKTTTLVEGLKRVKGLPTTIEPSPQQAVVWEAMEQGKGRAQTICFVAFNKSIATELQQRVPEGCGAMTLHSMGLKAITHALGRVSVNHYRVSDIISELLGVEINSLRARKPVLLKATEQLVGLCKMNLAHKDVCGNNLPLEDPDWQEALSDLASHYDVDLDGNSTEVFALVPRVLERCKDTAKDNCVDFNDMIWLPIVLDLPVQKYDMLLVDEAQDLNRCQQALAMKAGRRLILCGDPKQAIYGFAGADAESMERMERKLSGDVGPGGGPRCPKCANSLQNGTPADSPLKRRCASCKHVWEFGRGCIHLPLTVTRRCGKAIVREANRYVPDFSAFETNPEGRVLRDSFKAVDYVLMGGADGSYHSRVQNGDMILCRVNAPLVSECFKFLRAGRKANIQGRDVGQGLISTVKKMKSTSVTNLLSCLSVWLAVEQRKEMAKHNPSETRLIALQDRHDCLVCFTEGAATVEEVTRKIDAVFTDEKNGKGIMLSSVHKAKGLEAHRVFILQPKGSQMPHPIAKSAWQREQETNILYVAITRAIEELIYVS